MIESFSIQSSFKENTTLLIVCRGFGSPSPKARLIHNDSTIFRTDLDESSAFTSTIQWNVTRISSKDGGLYTCEFENVIGVASSNHSIVVKGMYSLFNI